MRSPSHSVDRETASATRAEPIGPFKIEEQRTSGDTPEATEELYIS